MTNAHVIEGASKVRIRGVKGGASKTYTARIIIKDKNNDLAILKIDDPAFTPAGDVPYQFGTSPVEVGHEVYVLGYPMTNTMGDEVKLTSGIISARSGYEGNVTTYQISAPVQPGNSGGPVFNKDGVIVGNCFIPPRRRKQRKLCH